MAAPLPRSRTAGPQIARISATRHVPRAERGDTDDLSRSTNGPGSLHRLPHQHRTSGVCLGRPRRRELWISEGGDNECAQQALSSSQRLIWLLSALLMALSCPAFADELSITPSTMVGIGTVDERLQSYNVEMVEGDRRTVLETVRCRSRRKFGPVPVPPADRSRPTPDCGSSLWHWGQPTFGSAAPGQTPLTLQRLTVLRPRRPRASTEFSLSSNGAAWSISRAMWGRRS